MQQVAEKECVGRREEPVLMRVLVCGHRSFAARGLIELLLQEGHSVTAFTRGPLAVKEERFGNSTATVVTGPVLEIDSNPHLSGPFDVVVNYVLLKDETIPPNVEFVKALLKLCDKVQTKHLIHISSISSYKANIKVVNEQATIEEVPEKKGSYGSLKVAQDQYLLANRPADLKMSLVRPGFILAPVVPNPIIGTAARLPWGDLLVIGSGKSIMPITTRPLVNRAVAKLVASPPTEPVEVIVMAARNSPTRVAFLDVCCRRLGIGTGVRRLPVPLWYLVAIGAEVALRMIGQGKLKPYSKLTARTPTQRYDATWSEQRLGFDLSCDWENELVGSVDGQARNYEIPIVAPPVDQMAAAAKKVTFLGFGRIVKQKHLPGLKKTGFAGAIEAYDVRPAPAAEPEKIEVRQLAGSSLGSSDLFIVASPGPVHADAIDVLANTSGPILIEKPLCYRTDELDRWKAFAAGRSDGVYVCHNYRLKQNVQRMLQHLAKYNPGQLDHVTVEFQSPPVAANTAAWARDERRARTLLMDYAIHFVDIGCLFAGETPWSIADVRHSLNGSGETATITGRLIGNYTLDFHLRQSAGPRRARVRFQFQNYVASLGFFPDTFVAHRADDNPWLHKAESKDSRRQTLRKIADKLTGRDSDLSHARCIGMAIAAGRDATARKVMEPLTIGSLETFYRALLEVAKRVYEPGGW
jgi:predicted dehydrogenase/nucleoside-diphosphate-sugar epimerase